MCGICGIIDSSRKRRQDFNAFLSRMNSSLAHRGPDDDGTWSDGIAFLGHRRLAIIAIEESRQPMMDSEDRFVIVFNGEIYNYLELAETLKQQGSRFRTGGDTEVLLEAYRVYGDACLDKLNGMFAFAVWDRKTKTLFMARDRLGKKPIYYIQHDGIFYFASELQAIKLLNLDLHMSRQAMCQYLRYGFIWSPDTIFDEVKELRPGHSLSFSSGSLSIRRYWSPPLPGSKEDTYHSVDDACDELKAILKSSVRLRLRSDVPLGAFLSGGLDSSVIVACMKELGSTDIHTFSVGFEDKTFDETPYAREVARHLGTNHHEMTTPIDAETLLPQLVRHYGQPFGDSSAIPTWLLSKLTKNYVTVALSGDGGDELFCGYRRYLARRLINIYQKTPNLFRKIMNNMARHLKDNTSYYDASIIKKIKLFTALEERVSKNPLNVYPEYFPDEQITALTGCMPATCGMSSSHEDIFNRINSIEYMMHMDIMHYLPDDILVKVDRASMAHALEVRSPFMDYRLAEFAISLPLDFKLKGLTTKYILRRAFKEMLPSAPLKRQKHGFAVPLGEWFKRGLADMLREILSNNDVRSELNVMPVKQMLDDHIAGRVDFGTQLWLILFLGTWLLWWKNQL